MPGTEVSTYCDGVAVSDSPMGPFINCDNSPAVFKNTGFMRGAGHGCLFEDKNGEVLDSKLVSEFMENTTRSRCLVLAYELAQSNDEKFEFPQDSMEDVLDVNYTIKGLIDGEKTISENNDNDNNTN